MKVLVDASALPAQRGGVGRYVDELIAGLASLDVEVLVACQRRDATSYEHLVGRHRTLVVPSWAQSPAARLLWEQVGLPRLVARHQPDVVHSPHYTLPLFLGRARPARVVTLHDATFFSHPEVHGPVKRRFFRAWTRAATRVADAVVVPSAATADEVVAHTGADRSRLVVIPHGVDLETFRPPTTAEIAEAREWLGLGSAAYIVFLGTIEPRKNVPALVRAYVQACSERPEPPVLVLAGAAGWETTLDGDLAAVPPPLSVLRTGFVPDGMVHAVLGGAEVMAYPSLGEGFGLPVLEAMAAGVAVLTTRELALPEVGGEAVAYAASPDADDIADALTRLLDDPDLRAAMRTDGASRALQFSWSRAAARHLEAYGTACSSRLAR